VNEWLLSKNYSHLFLFGGLHRLINGTAIKVPGKNDFLWLRICGDSPIFMVCQGQPLSLNRRLVGENCPPELLFADQILVTDKLDPQAVIRTWCGHRSDNDTLAFFGFPAFKGTLSADVTKSLTIPTAEDTLESIANSRRSRPPQAAYSYKYPVASITPSPQRYP
jgi:hypothetical protein